ncbi:MAG TPA: hypothetical protein DCF44_11735 [Chitinophagaceae bacterium]|nr:hypothetical protein [Chitinophagaceae bacterium]
MGLVVSTGAKSYLFIEQAWSVRNIGYTVHKRPTYFIQKISSDIFHFLEAVNDAFWWAYPGNHSLFDIEAI